MPDKEIICIVDDDADHCDALGFLLDNEGYEVQTYSSANDFLTVVPTHLPSAFGAYSIV